MTYQTHGTLATHLRCRFDPAAGIKPRCGWRQGHGPASGSGAAAIYAGTQIGHWPQEEDAWGHDTMGHWIGPVPLMLSVRELVAKAANGSALPTFPDGRDTVYRVTSGQGFRVQWTKWRARNFGGSELAFPAGKDAQWLLYNAGTGTLVSSGSNPSVPLSVAAQADGSLVLLVNFENVFEGLELPPGYARSEQYDYVTEAGRISHYNPYLHVGEFPAAADHPLRVLRRQIVANNLQEDNPQYIGYVTSETGRDTAYSAIKIQVGAGGWQCGTGVIPSPLKALHRLDFSQPITGEIWGESPATPVAIAMDPLAWQVTYRLKTLVSGPNGGREFLGGSRLSDAGPEMAVWEWDGDTQSATLLAATREAENPICECFMAEGAVTGMAELDDGTILVLGLCSFHRLDEARPQIRDRLPRYPTWTDGEPGGRCLVTRGMISHHFTERLEDAVQNDSIQAESYYNRLEVRYGTTSYKGPGTVFHGESCAWKHRGKVFGIRGDGPLSNSLQEESEEALEGELEEVLAELSTREYITFYDGFWNAGAKGWLARWIRLQRGCSVNGLQLVFGHLPELETARAIRDDGSRMRVIECDYRLRLLLPSPAVTEHYGAQIVPAREVLNTTQLSETWCLISLSGALEGEWDPEDPDEDDPDGPILKPDPPQAGAGLVHRFVEVEADSGPLHALLIEDMTPGRVLEAANRNGDAEGVWLRVDSDADQDDYASYLWRPRLGKTFNLPTAAYSKVELLVVSSSDLAPEELPEIAIIAQG